jgi:hypothetical protein
MADQSLEARRRFLKMVVAGAAVLPACALAAKRARAQEKVSPDDELAQQLGYVEDVSEVDAGTWPSYEDGQNCANCQLYVGSEGDAEAPCEIFGGSLVVAGGWCSAWIAKEA